MLCSDYRNRIIVSMNQHISSLSAIVNQYQGTEFDTKKSRLLITELDGIFYSSIMTSLDHWKNYEKLIIMPNIIDAMVNKFP